MNPPIGNYANAELNSKIIENIADLCSICTTA